MDGQCCNVCLFQPQTSAVRSEKNWPCQLETADPRMGGLFRVCLPNVLRNHPKRWEVARGDGFGPSATKWFFLQQAATRLVPWLFTTSLGAPNSRVWIITHRDATEFRRGACRSLPLFTSRVFGVTGFWRVRCRKKGVAHWTKFMEG